MRYLMRDGAPLSEGQWRNIDETVVAEARKILVGRRFLSLAGPLGAQVQNVPVDVVGGVEAASVDFWANGDKDAMTVASRRYVDLATVYSDFSISWRDVENENGAGLQAAADAAMVAAKREDELIFHGDKSLGIDGLLTAKGINKLPLSDWSKGENPVMDIAKGIQVLQEKDCAGSRALVLASDLYAKLHRIQQGTGIMEIDRVKSLVGSTGVFRSTRLDAGKAILVYCDPRNMDLAVGQDLVTAYMGNEKLDHVFRVMETVVPRIKRPAAVVVFG